MNPDAGARSAPGPSRLALAASLAVLAAAPYADVASFGYVNLDDQTYVYENPLVLGGLGAAGAVRAFTEFHVQNWHPLTWLSHMLDVSVFGPGPAGPHVENALLHALCAALLFAWLSAATGARWRSAAAAALFAVHPLAVESVAWVSERKSLLSTALLFGALWAWVAWVRTRRPVARLGAAVLLALGLLAKPMLVSAPLLLLLLDAWPLARAKEAAVGAPSLAARLREKWVFFGLAGATAAVTLLAQHRGGATARLDVIPLGARVANALVATVLYLRDAAWPSGLAAFYPHPWLVSGGPPAWQLGGAAAVLVAISGLAVWQRRTRPWLGVGWAWFLVALLPVIGLVQVGAQGRADRYTYLPLVGIYVAVAWTAAELCDRLGAGRWARAGLAAVPLAALAIAARGQASTWHDSLALHRRALEVTQRNATAWIGLGEALSDAGRPAEALGAYREALALGEREPRVWAGLGVALGRLGDPAGAEEALGKALALDPRDGRAWYNLGTALGTAGRHREAAAAFQRAVAERPDDARAWQNLVIASLASGEPAEARRALERLRELAPGLAAGLEAAGAIP